MLAKIVLIGNMGKKPEIKQSGDGKSFAKFSVATTGWSKTDGKATTWWDVTCFNDKKAQFLDKYAEKGSKVYVEGTVGKRTYIDKEGKERMSVDIIVNAFSGEIHLLGKAEGGEQTQDLPRDSVSPEDMPF